MTTRVVGIVQARMNSSRLPGKVLLDISGQPMLARVFKRAARASTVTETLVATTTDGSDDAVADFCRENKIPFNRGSQFDVLDRYYQSAKVAKADIVVRITGDCPVIDPQLMDDVVKVLDDVTSKKENRFDFAANRLPPPWIRTYPIGLDTEVCTFDTLERCWKEANERGQREHVMPYIYEGVELTSINKHLSTGQSPRGFKIALLESENNYGAYRWTVDAPEDLGFIRRVYEYFGDHDDFSWMEVLELVRHEPQLMEINAQVTHKKLGDIDERAGLS